MGLADHRPRYLQCCMAAISSHLTSLTSSARRDSGVSDDGGEIRSVGAAPSGKTTLTTINVKLSKPTTPF